MIQEFAKNDIFYSNKFFCKFCHYKCNKKSDLEKHFNSIKHGKAIGKEIYVEEDILFAENSPNDNDNKNMCDCGNIYKHHSGLWRHKKLCKSYDHNKTNISNDNIIELLKQNNEFKELLVEQNKMMIDMTTKMNTTINNTTNNNNTMNNKFNLNVFLNETCKDAINLNDFVKSLQITSADFERFGKNGFVEGISNIMVKGLNKLEVCKRPIHCSDLKRETIHLKEDNGWAKETDDGSKLKKVIKQIKHKNIDYTDAWKEENPEYKDFESKVHERYMKIMNESMGGYNNEEDEVFYNKIIKNVAKETVIKKSDQYL